MKRSNRSWQSSVLSLIIIAALPASVYGQAGTATPGTPGTGATGRFGTTTPPPAGSGLPLGTGALDGLTTPAPRGGSAFPPSTGGVNVPPSITAPRLPLPGDSSTPLTTSPGTEDRSLDNALRRLGTPLTPPTGSPFGAPQPSPGVPRTNP
jgi:hypothetical protein